VCCMGMLVLHTWLSFRSLKGSSIFWSASALIALFHFKESKRYSRYMSFSNVPALLPHTFVIVSTDLFSSPNTLCAGSLCSVSQA
jgi:hypothetical protein